MTPAVGPPQGPAPAGRPQLLVIAGPNGSGKTTLTQSAILEPLGLALPAHYINADEIGKELQTRSPDTPKEEREQAAFHEARNQRTVLRGRAVSFAFETVFSHPSTLLDISACRAVGYEVCLLYVTTGNADINVQRVADRVHGGGHDVPEAKVRGRYERSLKLLPRMMEEVDRAYIFDSTNTIRMVLGKGRFGITPYSVVPPYLNRRLLEPLAEREEERQFLIEMFEEISSSGQELGSCVGDYAGIIRYYSNHYLVQEPTFDTVVARKDKAVACHDVLLLQDMPSKGENVRIVYQDAVGQVSRLKDVTSPAITALM